MSQYEVWLTKSINDLKSAKILLDSEESVLDTAIYHTHQCAEKALKAYLVFHKKPIVRTHNLMILVDMCSDIDDRFKVFLDDAEILTPYNTVFRYPDILLEPDKEDVSEAIKKAEDILNFVTKLFK
ncbi:HEPN domain-containing protein [Candidatus Magnetobacterium bavaricum]|uniref:HEPN domain-containing protein n=1 Tax=Candidatus Magnetobacterium bavaricum TaxID=29290 RepID=A0A0F3GQ30_9BACT|nr:HEPN domain-containing protein [Candidatus Magnetobacterium bavaricum]